MTGSLLILSPIHHICQVKANHKILGDFKTGFKPNSGPQSVEIIQKWFVGQPNIPMKQTAPT